MGEVAAYACPVAERVVGAGERVGRAGLVVDVVAYPIADGRCALMACRLVAELAVGETAEPVRLAVGSDPAAISVTSVGLMMSGSSDTSAVYSI